MGFVDLCYLHHKKNDKAFQSKRLSFNLCKKYIGITLSY